MENCLQEQDPAVTPLVPAAGISVDPVAQESTNMHMCAHERPPLHSLSPGQLRGDYLVNMFFSTYHNLFSFIHSCRICQPFIE